MIKFVSTGLKTDFRGRNYSDKNYSLFRRFVIPRSDMRGSNVHNIINIMNNSTC